MNTPIHKNVAVVLTFEQGTFDSGFSVTAKVLENGVQIEKKERLPIPPIPDLQERYEAWKQQYIAQATRKIEIPAAQVHHANIEACREVAKQFLSYLNEHWFNSDRFQHLKEWIRSRTLVQVDQSVPIFFEFDTHSREQDTLFRRLPWSCWDLFSELHHAEPTLGIAYTKTVKSFLRNIKILAIFGTDEGGIHLDDDRKFVNELKRFGARVYDLSCPQPDDLYSALRHNTYDLLFFAGHSSSKTDQRDGEILLKPQLSVPLTALRPCLQAAVRKGLKLAIFNSCDGLGLADFLVSQAKIPSVIVFREPVPDEVARKFLQYFIEEFSRGTPLFLSVREARNRLQALENYLPCASWLPVVCQNPSQSELIWKKRSLRDWLRNIGIATISLASLTAVGMMWKVWNDNQIIEPLISTSPEDEKVVYSEEPESLISQGDKLILTDEKKDYKIRGIEAYSAEEWEEAIDAFRKSLHQELEENKQRKIKESLDPETVIYLNNAIAKQKQTLNLGDLAQLAVVIPAKSKSTEQVISKELLSGAALQQSEFNCGVDKLVAAIEDVEIPLSCKSEDDKSFIHLTIANDKNNEEIAQKVATQLSSIPVLGGVGHFSSVSCKRTIDIYKKNQIPMVSPTCTSTNLSDSSNYFFRTVPNDAVAAKSLWNRVGDSYSKTAIAYSVNAEYPESFKLAFEEQIPTQKYSYICHDLADNFDPLSCVKEAKANEANLLLLVPTTEKTLNAALSILKHLDRGIVPLGSDSVYNQAILDPSYGKEAVAMGLKIYLSWHPSSNPNNQTDFEKNATQLFNFKEWNWHSQSSYDALSALTQGIRELEGDFTGDKLMRKLRSSGFAANGVVGKGSVKFLENGDRDLTGFEDRIGTIVQVVEDREDNGEIRYRFQQVDE
jgi:branched-chain amino acid transport system substrate-binding protein